MSSEFSEFYNGVRAQEKSLFILREKCRDLAKEFPYLANTNRNTCTIPTPAIVFRDIPEVYGRNFENYKEVSIRILEGLKETWGKQSVDPRLIKEIDIILISNTPKAMLLSFISLLY